MFKSDIKKKKAPGREAGHRSPSWGCTKTHIFNKNQSKIKKSGNQPPVNHRIFSLFLSLKKRRSGQNRDILSDLESHRYLALPAASHQPKS